MSLRERTKDDLHAKIEQDIREFLAAGGNIKVVPTKTHATIIKLSKKASKCANAPVRETWLP